jgi:hypothetical protein
LVIGNRGNGNDGVIDNVKSPKLAESAGETSTAAAHSAFESSYWFRTASDGAVADYAFKTETYGPDRTTYFGVFSNGSELYAGVYGIDTNADFVWTDVAGSLNWGAWYRVVTNVVFATGPANDIVTTSLFGSDGTLLGMALSNSWEEGARQAGYNGGSIFAVDAVQFQARGSCPSCGPHDVAYVDDLTYRSYDSQSVPDAGSTMYLMGLALAGLAALRKRA